MDRYCSKCKSHKPLELFSKDRTRLDGVSPWCKECKRAGEERRRLARQPFLKTNIRNKEREELRAKGLKHCGMCDRILGVDMFATDNGNWDKKKSNCKTCCAKIRNRWYYSDVYKARMFARETKKARLGKRRQYARDYYRNNWMHETARMLAKRKKRLYRKEFETILTMEIKEPNYKRPTLKKIEILKVAVNEVMLSGVSTEVEELIAKHAMIYHRNEEMYFKAELWRALFSNPEFARKFWKPQMNEIHLYKNRVEVQEGKKTQVYWDCPRCKKRIKDGDILINDCIKEVWKENMWTALRVKDGLKFIRYFLNI